MICLLLIVHRVIDGCGLLVVANREESPRRPSSPVKRRESPGGTPWLGGIDRQAGGTWLGLNAHGLVVAVTNRSIDTPPERPRSRGLLCRDLLDCRSVDEGTERCLDALAADVYDGMNIAVMSGETGIVIEAAGEPRLAAIEPGFTCLTNGLPDEPGDPRIVRVYHEIAEIEILSPRSDWVEWSRRLCGRHAEAGGAALCRHEPDHQTVSAAVISLADDLDRVGYHAADGPPCRTTFSDYSAEARTLLAEQREATL